MDTYILNLLVIGLLLLIVTLGSGWINRLPLSFALIYLVVGVLLGSQGLGLINIRHWDNWFKNWVAVDLVWAIAMGIVMGILVAKAIVWLERKLEEHRPADDLMKDLVALSVILLTYSLTEVVNGYGFLAVFVAGLAVQRSYLQEQDKRMAQLEFAEQIEKILEIAAIVILGTVLIAAPMFKYAQQSLLVAGFLFLIVRPLGVWLSLWGSELPKKTGILMGWFGIKGLGSIYYLAYALGEGIKGETAEQISWITLTVVVLSIVLHGITAAPLMTWYEKHKKV